MIILSGRRREYDEYRERDDESEEHEESKRKSLEDIAREVAEETRKEMEERERLRDIAREVVKEFEKEMEEREELALMAIEVAEEVYKEQRETKRETGEQYRENESGEGSETTSRESSPSEGFLEGGESGHSGITDEEPSERSCELKEMLNEREKIQERWDGSIAYDVIDEIEREWKEAGGRGSLEDLDDEKEPSEKTESKEESDESLNDFRRKLEAEGDFDRRALDRPHEEDERWSTIDEIKRELEHRDDLDEMPWDRPDEARTDYAERHEEREHQSEIEEPEQRLESTAEDRVEGKLEHDRFDDFEESMMGIYAEYGADKEELREKWRREFIEEVEEEMRRQRSMKPLWQDTTEETDEGEGDKSGKTEEGLSYTEHGDGTVSELKTKGSSESTTETLEKTEHEQETEGLQKEQVEGTTETVEKEVHEEQGKKQGPSTEHHEKSEVESEVSERSKEREVEEHKSDGPEHTTKKTEAEAEQTSETRQKRRRSYEYRRESQEDGGESTERVRRTRTSSEVTSEVQNESETSESDRGTEVDEQDESELEELDEDSEHDEVLDEIREIMERAGARRRGQRELHPNEEVIGNLPRENDTTEEREKRELLEDLEEEEKRRMRELLTVNINSKEELDEFLENNEWIREYENFDEAYEYAVRTLEIRTRLEELGFELDLERIDIDEAMEATGFSRAEIVSAIREKPRLIRLLEDQERMKRTLWAHVVREVSARAPSVEVSESDLVYIESNLREIEQSSDSETVSQLRDWLEVMKAKAEGKIESVESEERFYFKEDQIQSYAQRMKRSKEEILSWLRGEKTPVVVESLLREQEDSFLETIKQLSADETYNLKEPELEMENLRLNSIELSNDVQERDQMFEVKAWIPSIQGISFTGEKDVKRILKEVFPGFLDRSDLETVLRTAKEYVRLCRAIGNRHYISKHDLKLISKELGIRIQNARLWVLKGKIPLLFYWLKSAISKTEGKRISTILKSRLDGIETWENVEERLFEIWKSQEFKKIKNFSRHKHRVIKYILFLKELEKGGTKKGIAKKLRMNPAVVGRWFDGNIPDILCTIIPSLEESKYHKLFFRLELKIPQIRRIQIESMSQLIGIIRKQFPFLFSHVNFNELFTDVEIHLRLYLEFCKEKCITTEAISNFCKDNNLTYDKVKGWLCEGQLPLLYTLLENALTVDEASEKIQKTLRRLNGVTNMIVLEQRLKHLFFEEELKLRRSFKKRKERARKFFVFLVALQGGGLISDIASRMGLEVDDIRSWFRTTHLPYLVRLIASCPVEAPKEGKKWLPLRVNNNGTLSSFIQVPPIIRSEKDITDVLEQIQPLTNPSMLVYEKQFSKMPRSIAFMYLLGAILSDGWFEGTSPISKAVALSQTKDNTWGVDFGGGFCYALGRVGFLAKRGKDNTIIRDGSIYHIMRWSSQTSPFMLWIKKVLFGLKEGSPPKSEYPITAEWIFKMPLKWRIAFLQGENDGDGFASIKHQVAGISTVVNQNFFIRLLDSLGIHSLYRDEHVRIGRMKDLRKIEQFPFFRHSLDRQENLKDIIELFDSTSSQPVTGREVIIILTLHREGYSLGEISEILWKEYKYARRISTISKVLKRNST